MTGVDGRQIKSEAVKSKEFQKQLEEQKKNIDQKNQEISKFHQQLEEHKKSIEEKNQQISKLQNDVNKSDVKLEDLKEINCTSFGDDPGVQKISFSHYSFDVLCDSKTAGPGWTVSCSESMVKKISTGNWATYREGFGSFDGDFFLGLEKIHRLTSYKPHELYICMKFVKQMTYARYEQFEIAGESDEYQLSLSGFSGNVRDMLSALNNNKKFSTYDRDNDGWNDGNCALKYHGGWWYPKFCGISILHLLYHDAEDLMGYSIDWNSHFKNVKMLIRPA
ncbi:ficolin-2 [Drosophila grimshawi]|uniref:ficolin-2 n=1 Tax=Drosophila grimshawi TaxID=7222 RepID=UPI001C9336A9|nr:ficolin-2 [Drosophila grimshawi]